MAAKRKKPTNPARKQGRPRKGTPDWAPLFLIEFRIRANVTDACRAASVDRSTVYQRLGGDPDFAAQFAEAGEISADGVEREIYRRAVEGWEEPVFYQGEQVATMTRYDSGLLLALARARRPEKWRERHDFRHSGKIETGTAETMTDAELEAIVRGNAS
jgi:hypothetical protein